MQNIKLLICFVCTKNSNLTQVLEKLSCTVLLVASYVLCMQAIAIPIGHYMQY